MKLPVLALLAVASAAIAIPRSTRNRTVQDPTEIPLPPTFEALKIGELAKRRAESGRSYLSFLERPSLSCGLYHLPAGGTDGQSPHDRDEVYYVLGGKSHFTAGEEVVAVEPGDVLFVAAGEEHRFHDIVEDLELLVFFSNARPKPATDGDGDR